MVHNIIVEQFLLTIILYYTKEVFLIGMNFTIEKRIKQPSKYSKKTIRRLQPQNDYIRCSKIVKTSLFWKKSWQLASIPFCYPKKSEL